MYNLGLSLRLIPNLPKMNKLILPLIFCFFSITVVAQKELTLKDAVLERGKSLAPKNLSSLSWIPDTEYFSWVDKEKQNIVISNAGDDYRLIITLDDLNAALLKYEEDRLKKIPQLVWVDEGEEEIDEKTFYFNHNCTFYSYSWNDAMKVLLTYDTLAENLEYNAEENLLAYTIENNVFVATEDQPKIQATFFEDKNIVSGKAIHRFEFGIRKGLFWSENGEKLAFYQMDESDVTDYPKINYSTYPASVEYFKYPMAGQKSHYAKVGIYDVDEKATVYLQTEGEKDHYLTNLAWSPDGEKIYLAEVNRDQNHMKLNVYDATSGEFIKTLFEEKDKKYVEPEHAPLFFKELEDQFVWYSERDGFNHLYLYNTNGKLQKQLTKGKFDVKDVLGISEDGKALIFSATDGLIETKLFSVDLKTAHKKTISTDPGTHSGFLSSNGKFLIDNYSSVDVPREIKLYKNGEFIKTLLKAKNPLAEHKIGKIKLFTIKAADGTTDLQCRMILPPNFDSTKKYPVFVYLYGGPHAQMITNSWLAGSRLWMLYMANQGYIVFTMDNRGSANRGLEFEQATFRELGKVEMADQLEGVEYLKKLDYVDQKKMAVHGWSFGGFMTVSLMLKHPDVFQVGVAGGPVTDWNYYEVMYTERYMDTPEQNPEGYENTVLKNYVDSLQGDLLLIHGLDDDIVVLQHNIMLLDAFIKKGMDVDFFNYPGHGHNVLGKDRYHLMDKVLDYVMEKMPEEQFSQ